LNIDNNILKHIQEFLNCETNKFQHTVPLKPVPQCSLPNQRIHIDLFGLYKASEMGNQYVLTMTDAFTKHSEIMVILNKKAETVTDAVFTKWI
jgi:hypothetical protein